MTQDNKGVFNGPQHAEEIDMLLRGEYKQFQLIPIDISNGGPAPGGGNRGLFEVEGNAIAAWPLTYNTDTGNETFCLPLAVSGGRIKSPIYVKFNHWDNPWLPLACANAAGASNIPGAYCLTFGRFWIWVNQSQALAGQFVYLLVTRGVSMYSPGMGPVVIGGYQAPTWQKLKG